MITLDATVQSELDWKSIDQPADVYLDLGLFDRLPKPLEDEAQFQTLRLALEHFRDSFWNEHVQKVYLYRGSVPRDRERASRYLSELTATLPDAMPLALQFDLAAVPGLLDQAFLTARDLYERFSLELLHSKLPEDPAAKSGILLPEKAGSYPALEAHLQHPCRIIPEAYLTQEWDGLDTLIISDKDIDSKCLRKIQGFLAAGGSLIRT